MAALLATVVVILLVVATPARAHSELDRSDPPNGGMIAVGRTALTLWFGEPIDPRASTFSLRTVGGGSVTATAAIEDGVVVHLTTPSLTKATYVLDWTVLALDDGHASRGSVLFGVGTRPDVVPVGRDAWPGTTTVLIRWLDLLCILLAIGVLSVSGRVLGGVGPAGVGLRRRSLLLGAVAVSVALASSMVTPLLRTKVDGLSTQAWLGSVGEVLTGSPWGQLWLARGAALAVAAVALWAWVGRPGTSPWLSRTAATALVAVAWLEALAGHPSTLASGSAVTAAASASHLVAAGVWAGGLVVLVVGLVPVMRLSPARRRAVLRSAWRPYSRMAAIAAVVLVATGLYEAGIHVPVVAALTSTVYGGAVVVKIALVALALGLAAVNTLVVNPRIADRLGRLLRRPAGWAPRPRRFATLVTAEAMVLVAAVGVAAVLTSVPTARETTEATKPTAPRSATVDGLFVTFEAVPTGSDRTRLVVRARSTVRPERGPISGVDVRWVGSDGAAAPIPFSLVETGRYEADTAGLAPGTWTARVAVHRSGLPDSVVAMPWMVRAMDTGSGGPLQVATMLLAAGLMVGLVLVLWLVRRARPRQSPRRLRRALPHDAPVPGAGLHAAVPTGTPYEPAGGPTTEKSGVH